MARKSGKGRAAGGGAGKTRQYVRDNSGRFASSPGGGKKAAAKPAANPAAKTPVKPKAPPKTTTARGRARTKAAEARKALKAGAGTRAARSLAIAQKAADYYKATGTGTKRKPARAAAKPAAKPAAKASKPAAKPRKMGKAPISRAKQNYQEARRQVREARMYRGGRTDATVKRLQAKVARMESRRRSSRAAAKPAAKSAAKAKSAPSKAAKPRAAAKPAGGVTKPAQAKPKQKTATQRAEAALERVRSVIKRAKYDPQNRRERNTARTAARAFGQFVDLGANPRYVASPADLRRLGRNLRNRTKLKEAGARNRWVSARSKEDDDRRRSRSGLSPFRR